MPLVCKVCKVCVSGQGRAGRTPRISISYTQNQHFLLKGKIDFSILKWFLSS